MLTLNREEVAAALKAVLDHVGTANTHLDYVGMRGNLLFATDGYTAGVSFTGETPVVGIDQEVYLPTKEARDLLRFVRPERVRDRDMRVEFLVAPGTEYDPGAGHPRPSCPKDCPWYAHSELELHVGIRPDGPNSDDITSEVYSLYPAGYPAVDFERLWESFQDIRKHTFYTDEFVLQPDLAARFKSAGRQFGDRMRWFPASPPHGRAGQRALVLVGSNFLGAQIGLGEPPENTDIPFRDSTLQDWGL